MSKISITLSICLTILLASCGINDSYKNCFCETNLLLKFNYNANTNYNVLSQYINSSILYIYDGELLIDSVTLDKDQLIFGTKLENLPKGKYKFITWGNVDERTRATSTRCLNEAKIETVSTSSDNTISSNDHLYYAYNEIEITDEVTTREAIQTKVIDFKSAHIDFLITVYSLRNLDVEVVFNNINPHYDFYSNPLKSISQSYYPKVKSSEVIENNHIQKLELSLLRFKDDNQITIDLKDASNGEYVTQQIKLSQLMKENNITVEDKQEKLILIDFIIGNTVVDVTIEEWNEDTIIPEN